MFNETLAKVNDMDFKQSCNFVLKSTLVKVALFASMTTLVELTLARSTEYIFVYIKSLGIMNFLIRLALNCIKWIKNGQILVLNTKFPS